jgi:hypothetical protein
VLAARRAHRTGGELTEDERPGRDASIPYLEESLVGWVAALVPERAEGTFSWRWVEGLAVLAGDCPRCAHDMSVVTPRPNEDATAAGATRSRQAPASARAEAGKLRTALKSRLPDRLSLEPRDGERRQKGANASRRGMTGPILRSLAGPAPDDLLVVAICNCLEPHTDRPDDKVGCGSYGALTLRWPRPVRPAAPRPTPPPPRAKRPPKAPAPDSAEREDRLE